MSLPTALKQLLTLRNPNVLASPGLSKLAPVLAATLKEARGYKAENGWLALATATFLTANSPAAVADLYRFTSLNGDDGSLVPLGERVAKASLMREAGLKCAVFVGVPKVINSLGGLTEALEDDVKAKLRTTPTRIIKNAEQGSLVTVRGKKLFSSVYDPHTEKLLAKLGSYHPDFPGFIVHNEYGALLSDPEQDWPEEGRIGRALTSVTGVACLRASGGVGPQLTSHVYGLLKAKGYDLASETPGDAWLASAEGATWVIGVVDQLVDVLAPAEESEKSHL